MINSREQYLFVDIPDGISVDGSIMPARDVSNDGSWKILRGEDPAFIAEAVAERASAVTGRTAERMSITREINGARICSAVERLISLTPPFCSKLQDVVGPVFGLQKSTRLDEAFDITITPLSRSNDFASGSPLSADCIRRIYKDLANARQFVVSGQVPTELWDVTCEAGSSYSSTKVEKNPGESFITDYEIPAGSVLDYYMADGYYGTGSNRERLGASQDSVVTSGTYSISIPETSRKLISSTRAFVNIEFSNEVVPRGGVAQRKHAWSFHEVDHSVDPETGCVSIGIGNVISAANSAIQAYNAVKHPIESDTISSQHMSAKVYWVYLLCTLTDHTDFYNLNWSWSPKA